MRIELVGREAELALLVDCLDAALQGSPRVVLCHGEPGIGKTRLAEELVTLARGRGVPAAWGAAVESSAAPPYWPWREVLRALADTADIAAFAKAHRLTGDLARLAPDVFGAADDSPDTTSVAEVRFRQFDAVAVLLRQLTRQQGPLLVVFDDAHAADEPSLLLLQHVTRSLRDEPLLIAVNYRDTEQPHVNVFPDLLRYPATRQLELRGLPPAAIARQLAALVGHDVAEADVGTVHAMTGGNPFFIAEAGRMLAEDAGPGHAPITANLREATTARLSRLSPECVVLLRAASIVGAEFAVEVTARTAALAMSTALVALDEAIVAGLIEPTPIAGQFRFVHVLVRDAIEAALSTVERVRLHRLAARALEEFYGDQLGARLFDVARHWSVAAVEGERAPAAAWIRRAGEEAMRQHAYEEAARLFRLALDVGGGELDQVDRCHLLLALGAAQYVSAQLPSGLDACLQAAALAQQLGRADLVAHAALVPEPTFQPDVDVVIRQLCERAIAVVGPDEAAVRARVLARFAEVCDYLGDVEPAGPASEEAVTLAEQSGDRVAVTAAVHARHMVRSGPDGVDERAGQAERMLALSRETGDLNAELSGHLWRFDVAFERGDLGTAGRAAERVGWVTQEIGGPFARWQFLRCQAMLAQAQARFADARRLANEALATVAPTGHPARFLVRSALLSDVGHHVGHDEETLASCGLDWTGPVPDFPTAGVMPALGPAFVLAEIGRVREAAAIYRSLGPVADWRLSPHGTLFAYVFGIWLAAALGASDDVASLRAMLSPYRGHHAVSGAGPLAYFGPVELWLGVGAAHLGLLDDAVVDLEHAVKATAANGAVGFHVEARYELARVLACRTRPADVARARALSTEAAADAQALGMTPFAAKARHLAAELNARQSILLTPREREVADLVAQGLTNREIADRLYLSERTAQNHVQHILEKLNLANRSQIAVWFTSEMSSSVE